MKNSFLSELLFSGRIPFLPFLQKVTLFFSLVPIIGIFFFPEDFRTLGAMCWNILIVILLIRPLGDIFTDFKIFRGLLPFRKELGILCGSLGISHSIGFFFGSNIPLPSGFLDPLVWNVKDYFFWGMIGFLISILLTLTSNIFSMRLLRSWWKRLHSLVYLFFIATTIHIAIMTAQREGG